jgi:hypothetical protein
MSIMHNFMLLDAKEFKFFSGVSFRLAIRIVKHRHV